MKNVEVLVVQSCQTLCDPTNISQPGSSVHGISQTRILEWVSISFSRGIAAILPSKKSACKGGDLSSNPGLVGKIPWRREWLPTSVFLSGEFHG